MNDRPGLVHGAARTASYRPEERRVYGTKGDGCVRAPRVRIVCTPRVINAGRRSRRMVADLRGRAYLDM